MRKTISTVLVYLFVVACGILAATDVSGSSADPSKDNFSPELRRELAQARAATARYLNIAQAMEDGYVDIDVFVPGMGFHYLKPAFLDETFQIERPELLVYAADPANNRLRLVAVEYAVPTSLSATAPEGFTGDADVWDLNEDFHLWTLHCWLWLENPHGMFSELNPRVP